MFELSVDFRLRRGLAQAVHTPILLAGPTTSGKSALALKLARSHGGVIINADSMQVYRDLRIITARPTPAEEAIVPHRLYGHVDAAALWPRGGGGDFLGGARVRRRTGGAQGGGARRASPDSRGGHWALLQGTDAGACGCPAGSGRRACRGACAAQGGGHCAALRGA